MKIEAEITGVDTNGDELRVVAQGTMKGMADWRPMLDVQFDVPNTNGVGAAYHVGRKLQIEIKTK